MEITVGHVITLATFFAAHIGTAIWWGARLSGKAMEHEKRIGDLETNLAELVKSLVIEAKRGIERSGKFGQLEVRISHLEQEVESLRSKDQSSRGSAA